MTIWCTCAITITIAFDLDLNFVRSIGSHGSGRGEFDRPCDVKFDTAGNMYVADGGNERVQVMDSSGRFIQEFGQGKLSGPLGLLIADKYVYVSDFINPRRACARVTVVVLCVCVSVCLFPY